MVLLGGSGVTALRILIRNGPIGNKSAAFAQAPQLMTRGAWLVPLADSADRILPAQTADR